MVRSRGVSAIGGLFPVISLEKEEAALVNLGQFQFEYEPLEKATSVWEFAKKCLFVCLKNHMREGLHTSGRIQHNGKEQRSQYTHGTAGVRRTTIQTIKESIQHNQKHRASISQGNENRKE